MHQYKEQHLFSPQQDRDRISRWVGQDYQTFLVSLQSSNAWSLLIGQDWLASRYNEKFLNGPANAKDQEKFLKNKVEDFEKEKNLYLELDYEEKGDVGGRCTTSHLGRRGCPHLTDVGGLPFSVQLISLT